MKKLIITLLTLLTITTSAFCQNYSDLVPETPEQKYFVEFTQKQQATQNRIKLFTKKNPMAKLGTETVQGYKSGEIVYQTKLSGTSAICTITYTNFSDEDGWIFNGQIITTVNIKGDGTITGNISSTGNYTGIVYYDNAVLEHSQVTKGTYGVVLNNNPRVELPFYWFIYAMALLGK